MGIFLSKILTNLNDKFSTIIEEMGYELVDIKYQREGNNWYLRFFIDKENGIVMDDCSAVSRKVDKILDELDIIPNAYILEVSSPGAERPLKKPEDFERYQGEKVIIKTKEAIENSKTFIGNILNASLDSVTITKDKTEIVIHYEKIKSANLSV